MSQTFFLLPLIPLPHNVIRGRKVRLPHYFPLPPPQPLQPPHPLPPPHLLPPTHLHFITLTPYFYPSTSTLPPPLHLPSPSYTPCLLLIYPLPYPPLPLTPPLPYPSHSTYPTLSPDSFQRAPYFVVSIYIVRHPKHKNSRYLVYVPKCQSVCLFSKKNISF